MNPADYGTFVIDPNTGEYTFKLNNSLPAVKALSGTDSLSLRFTITVTDQHGATAAKDVVVQISGANDAPELTLATVSSDPTHGFHTATAHAMRIMTECGMV